MPYAFSAIHKLDAALAAKPPDHAAIAADRLALAGYRQSESVGHGGFGIKPGAALGYVGHHTGTGQRTQPGLILRDAIDDVTLNSAAFFKHGFCIKPVTSLGVMQRDFLKPV